MTEVLTLTPPMPPLGSLDPIHPNDLVGPRPKNYSGNFRWFVRYNTDGSILFHGRQAAAFTSDEIELGANYCFGPETADPEEAAEIISRSYVTDLDTANPILVERPVLDAAFDTLTPAAGAAATMPDAPPCTVTFTGPMSGRHEHTEQGDLSIGWTMPGTYLVEVLAWPCLPATFTFTVGV